MPVYISVIRKETTSTNALARTVAIADMGWALKFALALKLAQTSRARFPDKQREYVTNKFLKANPLQVVRSMITARDGTGNRKFASAEFLTVNQITSFFSRLTAKRSISVHVTTSVQPNHPSATIFVTGCPSPSCHLCNYHAEAPCEHFVIGTDDITSKRKAPYISRLENFLKQCTCCQILTV